MANEPNLMPEYLLERRSRRRRILQWRYVLGMEICAVGAAVALLMAQVEDPASETREAVQETVGQIDVVSAAVSEARVKLQEVQQRLAVAQEVVRKPDWSILITTLAWEGQGKVVFDSLQLSGESGTDAGGYRVSMTGTCDGQRNLTDFVQSLERTGLFSRVKITHTQSIAGAGVEKDAAARLGFTIDARIDEG